MPFHLRIAVWAVLLASTSPLDAQSAESAAITPLRTMFSWACGNSAESGPKFELIRKPLVPPPGLNLGSGCMPTPRTDFLQVDPRSLVTIPVESGSPKVCGVARYRGGSIRFCTRG